jgi:NAD(P)-dependent dehydrogenase (short-subunit alcohol dehydrogenase family)
MAAKYGSGQIQPGGSRWSLGASICAAMEGLTRALAVELAPTRVNIVSPGVVKSPLWAKTVNSRSRDALYHQTAAKLPVAHIGEVEELPKPIFI